MRPELHPDTTLDIIIPMLNEAAGITAFLQHLQPLRRRGARVTVVDGGSSDGTPALCAALADAVLAGPRGRARQMNCGGQVSHFPHPIPTRQVLLFVHADTVLPADADHLIQRAISGGAAWGRFDVRISGRSRWLAVVGTLMNLRSRWSGIATGDQAMFVRRDAFDAVGGFPDQPLMEDIELSRRLCRIARPACLRERVTTSGRRWDTRGVWPTIWLMWTLRWRYWRGAAPEDLARDYR